MDWTPHAISNVTTILANRLRGLPDPSVRWSRAQRDEIERTQRDTIHLAVQLLDEVRRTHAPARVSRPAPAPEEPNNGR